MSTPAIPADIKAKFDTLKAKTVGEWDLVKANLKAAGWLTFSPSSLSAAVQVFLAAVEEFVGLADASGMVNEQKKAAVIAYADLLYEAIVAAELPTIAIGPAKLLEGEINSGLSGIIEFLVAKAHGKSPVPLPVPVP